MSIDVYLRLDDIGLFKKRRPHETLSQRERAEQIRDQFAHCMTAALRWQHCIMPNLCASGEDVLLCEHLHVDYSNFTQRVDGQGGIPLTGRARKLIDARLRAIGTQVYRKEYGIADSASLPGDIHMPALQKVSTFTGTRKAASRPRAAANKESGFLGRLLGSLFE